MENSDIEKKVSAIEDRNARVEAEKAWETSRTRKIAIALLTYSAMVIFMASTGVEAPWQSALVPTLGFVLSTLSLSFLKDFWLKKNI